MALTAGEVRSHIRHLAVTETDPTMPIPALADGESYELTLIIHGDGGDFVRQPVYSSQNGEIESFQPTTHGGKPAAKHTHHKKGA